MSLDEEPLRKSASFMEGAKSVERDESTPIPPNEYKRRSNFSQGTVPKATAKTEYGTIRHQLVLQNKTVTTTKYRDEECLRPAVKIDCL